MTTLDPAPTLDTLCDPSGEPELVELPAGSFLMGGIPDDKFVSAVELPRHPVSVAAFALGRSPVTRREWQRIMGSLPPGIPQEPGDDCPVVNVTFSDVLGFLREGSIASGFTYRLPSESEWEYACRAGSTTVFPQGSNLNVFDANFLYDESGESIGAGQLTPVGHFPPNAFGLFDMLGNVCEWTADPWHPGYEGAPTHGCPWTAGGKSACRAIRGGAWDHLPRVLRASWRDWAPENARWDNLGFRVARDL